MKNRKKKKNKWLENTVHSATCLLPTNAYMNTLTQKEKREINILII